MIITAIKKALDVPQSEALKRVVREKSDDRVVFCQYVQTGNLVRAKATSEVVEINNNVSYKDSNVVYLINCGHCGEQYIRLTERPPPLPRARTEWSQRALG